MWRHAPLAPPGPFWPGRRDPSAWSGSLGVEMRHSRRYSPRKIMNQASRMLNLAAAFALTTLSATALAQSTLTYKATCQGIGSGVTREPLGDREGHDISVTQSSCRVEGGPMDGSIATITNVWEWDKGNAVVLSGYTVFRQSGGMAVYQSNEGRNSLTMTDGKVTGFAGNPRASSSSLQAAWRHSRATHPRQRSIASAVVSSLSNRPLRKLCKTGPMLA